jgi:hypothetical protein
VTDVTIFKTFLPKKWRALPKLHTASLCKEKRHFIRRKLAKFAKKLLS